MTVNFLLMKKKLNNQQVEMSRKNINYDYFDKRK